MLGVGLATSGPIAWRNRVFAGAAPDVKKELIHKLLFLFPIVKLRKQLHFVRCAPDGVC